MRKKHRVPDTYYVNNDYIDVTNVHEDYVELRTVRRKRKIRRDTNKTPFSRRICRKYRIVRKIELRSSFKEKLKLYNISM